MDPSFFRCQDEIESLREQLQRANGGSCLAMVGGKGEAEGLGNSGGFSSPITGVLLAISVKCHMSHILLFGQVPFQAMRRSLSCLPNLRLSGRDNRYSWPIWTRYLI